MKIKLRLNGGEVKEYPSIKEAKKMLNESDYYCDRLEIVYNWEDAEVYTNKTCLSELYRQSCIYGEGWLNVFQIYESK